MSWEVYYKWGCSLPHLYTLTHTCIAQEREIRMDKEGGLISLLFWILCLGFGITLYDTLFFGHCILVIYINNVFAGIFSLGFPKVNFCVPRDCVSFSDPIYDVIVKMY